MRTTLRTLFVLTALATLLAVPAMASAYAPNADEFVTCIQTEDNNVECVVGLLEGDCLGEVVADRAKQAVRAAADRRSTRGPGNNPNAARYDFRAPADAVEGDVEVTIDCGPTRVRGVLVASEAGGTLPAPPAGEERGAMMALATIAGLLLVLGAVELRYTRRRRHR